MLYTTQFPIEYLLLLSRLETEMTVLLGQILFTSFAGYGFQFVASPSIPPLAEQIFREQIVEAQWEQRTPPPKGWRAAYILQLEPHQTIFGWAYHDGRDEYGRDHVPYFFGHCLSLPLDRVILDLIIAFLGKGPATIPPRQNLIPELEDIFAPELWSYVPQRLGVFIESADRENAYRNLVQRSSIDLFVEAPPEPLLLELDEQICELISLLLAPYLGPQSESIVQQVVNETASLLEPQQRVLQVIDRLAAELDDELSKAEFTRRIKAVLGIVGPQK